MHAWRWGVLVVCAAGVVAACGSRTGLEADNIVLGDASLDVAQDTTIDEGIDASDADADFDGGLDAQDESILVSCAPKTCGDQGFSCGWNGDGCGNVINCGPCQPLELCGAGGFSKCAAGPPCAPKSCQSLGFNCGAAGDGCGGSLSCGICQYPDSCGTKGASQCGNSLPCTNLCKQQVACDAGTTTISGTVIAGTLPKYGTADPIYNALVYVPNAAVKAFAPGVACNHCGAEVTGEPLVATTTAADGTFTLTNVPAGNNIPLVIQLGRFRRQVVIPTVTACQSAPLPTSLTRLPRNASEGDIPQMAIATGNADALECVLLKMGIDQAEFTQPNSNGRVHIYRSTGANDGNGTPQIGALVSNSNTLANYDIVLLPCESAPTAKAGSDQQNLVAYSSAGGRIFITHYGYEWLYNAVPFSNTATFNMNGMGNANGTASINTSFAGGLAASTWMNKVGALNGPNQFAIVDPRFNLDSVANSSELFVSDLNGQQQPFQYAFNTPVAAQPQNQCGRVVYSTFHVASAMTNGQTFPAECNGQALTPQEKNLEFMLFDVANCIPNVTANCKPLTCKDQNIACGPAGDGCGQQLNCGACTMPDTCGGNAPYQCGTPDAGSCVPATCQSLGFNCGANGDGCGNVIQCGTCSNGQVCGGGGKPGLCGP